MKYQRAYWSQYTRNNLKLSEEDKDLLLKYNVCLGGGDYPVIKVDGKSIKIHRIVADRMNLPSTKKSTGLEIDHINSDKFDNRRENLRVVTHSVNRRKEALLTSKGYCYDSTAKKYLVSIHINSKHKYIGRYATPEEARKAYKKSVKTLLGIDITD